MDICHFVSQAEAQTQSPPFWSAHSSSFLYSGSRPSLYCQNLSPQRPFRDHESDLRCDDHTRPDYFILFFFVFQLTLFLAHLQGDPIGLSVGGIAVVNKSLFLTVSMKNIKHEIYVTHFKKRNELFPTSDISPYTFPFILQLFGIIASYFVVLLTLPS